MDGRSGWDCEDSDGDKPHSFPLIHGRTAHALSCTVGLRLMPRTRNRVRPSPIP